MADGLVGIIGGTGLGDALAENMVQSEFRDIETPFGRPSTKLWWVGWLKTKLRF